MTKVIGWGIWGAGAIADLVAADFSLTDGATLRAVASRTPERARRFASRHQIAKSYDSLQGLLNDPEVDVVYIATPNHRHVDDCLACLHSGKAVLCEKPFALNLPQARKIVNAARERNVFCMEAMWTRFIPAVRNAKRSVDSGLIGPVRLMQGNFAYPVATGLENRFFNPDFGGGALLDRGVYLISLAQYLLGTPQSVAATASLCDVGAGSVDEQSSYQLTYANGALADFAASLRVRGTNEVVISGESGSLRLCEPFYCAHRLVHQSHPPPARVVLKEERKDDDAPRTAGLRKIAGAVLHAPSVRVWRRRLSSLEAALHRGRVQTFPFAGNGYQFELSHVVQCMNEQRTESPIMPLDDSLEVMRIMDSLRLQMHSSQAAAV